MDFCLFYIIIVLYIYYLSPSFLYIYYSITYISSISIFFIYYSIYNKIFFFYEFFKPPSFSAGLYISCVEKYRSPRLAVNDQSSNDTKYSRGGDSRI